MKSNKTMTYLLAVLVVGLLGLGYLFVSGNRLASLQASGSAIDGKVVGGGAAIAGAGGALCDTSLAPVLTVNTYWVDQNSFNVKAQKTTAASIYKGGASQSFFASTVTPNSTTAGQLACGDKLKIVYGSSAEAVTTYYRLAKDITISANSQLDEQEIRAYAAPTNTFANSSGTYVTDQIKVANGSWSAGSTYSGITLRVKAPAGAAEVYGDQGWGVCFKFLSSNISKVYPSQGQQVSVGHVKATTVQDTVQCYDMSSLGLLELGKQFDLTVNVQAASGAVPANNTNITTVIIDKAVSMYGSEAKIGWDKSTDPNTDTGGADLKTDSAILVSN